eukprot:4132586-Pleurochrysis_carterae.AAC.1
MQSQHAGVMSRCGLQGSAQLRTAVHPPHTLTNSPLQAGKNTRAGHSGIVGWLFSQCSQTIEQAGAFTMVCGAHTVFPLSKPSIHPPMHAARCVRRLLSDLFSSCAQQASSILDAQKHKAAASISRLY